MNDLWSIDFVKTIAVLAGGVAGFVVIWMFVRTGLRTISMRAWRLLFVPYAPAGPMSSLPGLNALAERIDYELEDERHRRFLGLRFRYFKRPYGYIREFRWENPNAWELSDLPDDVTLLEIDEPPAKEYG